MATSTNAKASPSQMEMLDSLVALAVKTVNDEFTAVIGRMVTSLQDVSEMGIDVRTVHLRMKSGNVLKANSYAYFHLVSTALELAIRKDIETLLPAAKAPKRLDKNSLSLVPFEEMDSKVAFGAIGKPFEMKYSEELATLNVRLGFMLERDILRLNQNPFRPELFLQAINDAWVEFEPDADGHPLMLPLLNTDILFDFKPMYEAMNEALQRKGRQPGDIDGYKIRKADHHASEKALKAKEQAALAKKLREMFGGDPSAPTNELGIPLIPDLPTLPSAGEGGWRPSTAGAGFQAGTAQAPVPAAPNGMMRSPAAVPQGQPHPHPGIAGAYQGGAMPTGGFVGGAVPHPGFAAAAGQAGAMPAEGFVAGQPLPPGFVPSAFPGEAPFFRSTITNQILQKLPAGVSEARTPMFAYLTSLQQPEDPAFAAIPQAQFMAAAPAGVVLLPQVKASMPQGALSRGDENTFDLLSRIFDKVFHDESIPQEVRDLIHYLQIPVLKAALLDKDFFFQEAHPARRMIDMLSQMGWEDRKTADDPLFQAMQRTVDRVASEVGQEQKVFAEAVAELEAQRKVEEIQVETAIAAPKAAAIKQERLAVATRSAKHAVSLRVGKGEVVAVVENFLSNKWTSVLTLAYSVEQEKPGAVKSATRTMDDLIWSVKPKLTQDQRKDLIAKLPNLLVTLNKWLDIIKWQDADRLRFFAELAECHATIVRAPIELAPERQLELAVEAAQKETLRRMELEKAAEDAATAEAEAAEARVDDAVRAIEALERGHWVEFDRPEGLRKVKLAWVSPLRTLYIFSTNSRQEAFSISGEQLAADVRAGSARPLAADGVVTLALSAAMEDMATNDPSLSVAA